MKSKEPTHHLLLHLDGDGVGEDGVLAGVDGVVQLLGVTTDPLGVGREVVVADVDLVRVADVLNADGRLSQVGPEGALERGEGDDDARGRAVGVRDDEALLEGRGVQPLLLWDDREVGRVHERNDERDVRVSPVVFRIREDGELRDTECVLCMEGGLLQDAQKT